MFKPRLTWTLNPGVTLAVDYNPDFVWPVEEPVSEAVAQAAEAVAAEAATPAEMAATATANVNATVDTHSVENTVSAPPPATEQGSVTDATTAEGTAQSAFAAQSALAAPAPDTKPTEAPVAEPHAAPVAAGSEVTETAAMAPQPDKAEPTGETLTAPAPAMDAVCKIEQDEVSADEDALPEGAAAEEKQLSHEELVAKAKAALDYAQQAAERVIAQLDSNRTSSPEAEARAQAVEQEFIKQGIASPVPDPAPAPSYQREVDPDFVKYVAEVGKANEAAAVAAAATATPEAVQAATAEPTFDSSTAAPAAVMAATELATTTTTTTAFETAPQAPLEFDSFANTAAPAPHEEQGLDEATKSIFEASIAQMVASGKRMEEELKNLNAKMDRDQEQYAALFNGGNGQQMMGNPAFYDQGNNAFPQNDQFMQDPAMAGYNGYNGMAPQVDPWQQSAPPLYGQQAPQQGYDPSMDDPYWEQSAMNNDYAEPQGNNQGYMPSQGASNAWQGQNAGVQGPKGDYWGEMNNGDYGYSGADMNQASGFGQNYGSNPNYGGNNYGGNPNYGDNSGFARYKVSMATRSRPDADVFIDLSEKFTFLPKLVFYLLERGLRVAQYTPEWSYTQTDVILLSHSIEGFLSNRCFVMREDNKRDLWAFLQQEFRM